MSDNNELLERGVIRPEQRTTVRRVVITHGSTVGTGKSKHGPTLQGRFAVVNSAELATIERAIAAAGLPAGAFEKLGEESCRITWVVSETLPASPVNPSGAELPA